jgi:hypothetical protein
LTNPIAWSNLNEVAEAKVANVPIALSALITSLPSSVGVPGTPTEATFDHSQSALFYQFVKFIWFFLQNLVFISYCKEQEVVDANFNGEWCSWSKVVDVQLISLKAKVYRRCRIFIEGKNLQQQLSVRTRFSCGWKWIVDQWFGGNSCGAHTWSSQQQTMSQWWSCMDLTRQWLVCL